jgi:hypothetical protein
VVATLLFVAAGPALAQTNYPAEITIELRDSQGRLLSASTPACPAEGIDVHSTGWLGDSDNHGTFHSDPVDLGTHKVNSAGVLDFRFHVNNVVNGIHTVELKGTGANGQPRTVEASILCECKPAATPPLAVAGSSLSFGKTDDGSTVVAGKTAFGKTGSDAMKLVVIALDLLAVGLALTIAARKARAARLQQRTAG